LSLLLISASSKIYFSSSLTKVTSSIFSLSLISKSALPGIRESWPPGFSAFSSVGVVFLTDCLGGEIEVLEGGEREVFGSGEVEVFGVEDVDV
jgi:hypothetical protein